MKLVENAFNTKFIRDASDKNSILGIRAEMEFIFDNLDNNDRDAINREVNKCFEVLKRHFESRGENERA